MTELAITSYLVNNPERYKACRRYLQTFTPNNTVLRWCWEMLRDNFERLDFRFPTQTEALWWFQHNAPESAGENFRALLPTITSKIYNPEFTDVTGDMLGDLLMQLERERFITQAQQVKSIQDLELLQTNLDEIRDALTATAPTWFTPFADPKLLANPMGFIKEFWGEPIGTGMPNFDAWLKGGFMRGELITLIGLTGGGKSLLLLWWCLSMAMRGYRTVYFSFDNVAGELLTRALCAVSGIPIDQEVTEEYYARKLHIQLEQFPGLKENFHIQKWPRGKNTIDDIERVIDQIEQRFGYKLDVGCYDYGDCIKPRGKHRGEKRFELDEIFSDLAALAEERDMVNITPTQSNKIAKWIDTIDIDNAAESWQKMWHSSIAMAISQTSLEKMMNLARIVVGKARRKLVNYIVSVIMDPGRMMVVENPNVPIMFRAAAEQAAAAEKSGGKKKDYKGVEKMPPVQEFVAPIIQAVS